MPAAAQAAADHPHTVDAVIASVDGTAITLSDALRAFRLALFLAGRPIAPPDAEAILESRDRLIDQALLLQEADAENITSADSQAAAEQSLAEVRKKHGAGEKFQSALRSLGMSEPRVLAQLVERDRVLRLIERRLRPSAQVEPSEIETYYHQVFVPEFAQHNSGAAPELSAVADQIRAVLVEKRVNELLEAWLSNLRSSHQVKTYKQM